MGSKHNHIPDYLLEQYALGELPTSRMTDLDKRVSSDPDLAARLDGIRKSNSEILMEYPVEELAEQIRRRYRLAALAVEEQAAVKKPPMSRRWYVLAPAFSAALVLLFLLIQPDIDDPHRGPLQSVEEHTREKGLKPHLRIYRKVRDDVELITEDSVVRGGDMLQISYVAHGRPFGVIVSIDGRGAVTLHYPDEPSLSTALEQDGEVHVPYAYEIDDAPEFERFFFVTATAPIQPESVLASARSMACDVKHAITDTLALGSGFTQSATLIRKQEVRK